MPAKRNINVHIYVTPVCNLKCKHCYYESVLNENKTDQSLCIYHISKMIQSLCDSYEADIEIEGGELTLRPDISKLFSAVPTKYLKNITLTTNGTVKINIGYKYLRILNDFRISLEGHTDKLNKDIRGVGLNTTLKTCSNLHNESVPFTLRITLHKKNYTQIVEMISYFVDLGYKSFSFFEFQPVGRGFHYRNDYCLDNKEAEEIIKLILSRSFNKKGIQIKLNFNNQRVSIVHKHKKRFVDCGFEVINVPVSDSLTIDYNGRLGVCPWNIGGDMIGRFNNDTFIKDVDRYMNSGELTHKCNHCTVLRVLYKG